MSVSLTKSPPELVFAGNCIIWCLQSSDLGDDDLIKLIGYQLLSDGVPVMAMKSIRARAENTDECINFERHAKRLVFTSIPKPEASATPFEDTNAMRKLTLKYGSIEIDKVECSNTVSVDSESDEIRLINAAFPKFINPQSLVQNNAFVMSDRPKVNEFTPTSHDWIWVYGGSTVVITAWNTDNNIYYTQAFPTPDNQVTIVPIGIIQHSLQSTTPRFRVVVNMGSSSKTYWFFKKCVTCDEYNEVLFLEQKGGRSTVIFDCDIDIAVSSTSQTVKLSMPCVDESSQSLGYDRDILTSYGETIADKVSKVPITLRKVIEDDPKLIEYYKQFLASPSHHLKIKLPNGEWDYVKFNIVSSGSGIFQSQEDTILSVTGEYHLPVNFPNSMT